MIYREIPPPLILADFVRHFWYIEYDTDTAAQMPFRLMADGFPSLIFQYKNKFKKHDDLSVAFPDCLLFGHTSRYLDLIIEGAFGVFGVAFFPFVPSLLFGITGTTYCNHVISSIDLLKPSDRCLEEQIALAETHTERINILSEYLIGKLNVCAVRDPLIQSVVRLMVHTGGHLPVERLMNDIAVSRRQLERRFGSTIGMSPKLFSRIIRFQNCLKDPRLLKARTLTEFAYINGYADQSHFNREFQAFSGINPGYYYRHLTQSAENLIQL